MLPRSQRLSAEELNTVMEKGRVTHSSLFLIRSLPVTTGTKIAAVAPQKIFKTAVARSNTRRRIYNNLPKGGFVGQRSQHIVLVAKPAIIDADSKAIQEDTKALFVKIGILR
jgi:ribonuclease P protein component